MRIGHPARACKTGVPAPRRSQMGDVNSERPRSGAAFLPSRATPAGRPPLSGRVALVEAIPPLPADVKGTISRGLAARFGGSVADYMVADFKGPRLAIFFPNWVERESAIGRSPLRLEGHSFRFSDWVESEETGRCHHLHKAWIKLHGWPIACWNSDDVTAAVSGFGAFWEDDDSNARLVDVGTYRVRIRCSHVRCIPETLLLSVDDRCFNIRVEIESWEEANPILLGEDLDSRLGLETAEDQEAFLRGSGFANSQSLPGPPAPAPRQGLVASSDVIGCAPEGGRRCREGRTVRESCPISNCGPAVSSEPLRVRGRTLGGPAVRVAGALELSSESGEPLQGALVEPCLLDPPHAVLGAQLANGAAQANGLEAPVSMLDLCQPPSLDLVATTAPGPSPALLGPPRGPPSAIAPAPVPSCVPPLLALPPLPLLWGRGWAHAPLSPKPSPGV